MIASFVETSTKTGKDNMRAIDWLNGEFVKDVGETPGDKVKYRRVVNHLCGAVNESSEISTSQALVIRGAISRNYTLCGIDIVPGDPSKETEWVLRLATFINTCK